MTDTPTAIEHPKGRKRVRLRLRPNLVLSCQEQAGRACTIVKDPVSLSYYRLDDRQRFIAGLLDGAHTLEQIRAAYERRYAPERLSLEELEDFTAQLLNSGLVQPEAPLGGCLLFERSQKQRRARRRAALLNFLTVRIPLLDPDRLLSQVLPRVRFMFTPGFLLLGCGLVLSALALLATHWNDFLARLPTARDFFSPQTILTLWLTLGLVKILHELGHGLCCKACGGEVHETGVLLLVFFPALYCDVSDGWMLPRKWQRIAISLAGIYVELLIAGLATLLWWATDPATVVHNFCLGLVVVCSVNTVLFNANPLMRFDGYYALSDWLEIPNLSTQANRVVQVGVMRWLGIHVPADLGPAARQKGFLAVYAISAYLYRCMVLAGVFWVLYAFLEPRKLSALWYAVTLASLAIMLGWPVVGLGQALYRQGRLPDMKPVRLWLAAGILGAVAVVICFVPFPVTVRGAALLQVEPDQVQRVMVPEPGGFLKELLVKDGQRVRTGDVLAVLANPELEIKLRLNEADQALRGQQQSALLAQVSESTAIESQAAASLQQVEHELAALVRAHAMLQEQRGRLTLRAPCGGTVLGLCPVDEKGRWLEHGIEVCRVGNGQILRAVMLVEPADRELIGAGKAARVRVHGGGSASWPGVVTEIAQVEAKSIPEQLSRRAGGDVAAQADPLSKTEQPYQPHYLCAVRLHGVDTVLHPGALGRVRIGAGSQSLWWRFRRWVGATFHWAS